ncbi:WH1-domain-containing protein [Cubamyces sp. BRFM 1775]|nr:WH1-domain-containing protein [Cubamyces sp. BRFM 1775]
MPAQSTLSSDEKTKVKAAVNSPANKIFTAALARIYYAYPKPDEWSYTGLQGALAFVKDTQGVFYLKLVDLAGTRGIIWEHELYEGFEYNQDRSFFHSFPGDDCMIGIVFADESEAKTFYKKVTSKKTDSELARTQRCAKPSKGGKIDKSMISGPTAGSFKHVAHMGYDADKGFTSTNVDPSWEAFLGNLEGQGISRDVLEQNMDFIKDFVRDAQKAEAHSGTQANGSGMKKKPPPPPAPRRAPPPPPPPPPAAGGSSASTSLPAPQAGRDALMASIQGAGVHMLKRRTDAPAPSRSPPPAEEPAAAAGGGGDLTAALVAALTIRNKRMGDSDEEEEEEEEEW